MPALLNGRGGGLTFWVTLALAHAVSASAESIPVAQDSYLILGHPRRTLVRRDVLLVGQVGCDDRGHRVGDLDPDGPVPARSPADPERYRPPALEEHRAFLRFDLRTVPDDAKLVSATLWVWIDRVCAGGTVDIHAVQEPWTERGLSGAAAPELGARAASVAIGPRETQRFLSVDVTDLARDWREGRLPNHGLALVASPGHRVGLRLDSKENTETSHAAHLEMSFEGPPGPPGERGPRARPACVGRWGLRAKRVFRGRSARQVRRAALRGPYW